MSDLPAEITAALIVLAVAILGVGALLVRAYGTLVKANLDLAAAKQDHEKTELSNQSKLEALAVQMAENNARQNTALQDAITKLTSEFSRQTGELSGQLKAEQNARKAMELKYESLSEQKVKTAQELFTSRESLVRTEQERDQLKLNVAKMSTELAELPKLRAIIDEQIIQIADHTSQIKRQAQEIQELKEREQKRHDQINEWQASEMERKAELEIMIGKYKQISLELNQTKLSEAKLRLELGSTHEALYKANEIIRQREMELKRLEPLVAVSDLESGVVPGATHAGRYL